LYIFKFEGTIELRFYEQEVFIESKCSDNQTLKNLYCSEWIKWPYCVRATIEIVVFV